ncbi:protein dmr6-like oxygenase 2 [Quercus suber]|uniref:Protein dmr6-like oxygenase 2 n=1 Tax=Quercus suber TaxID=58331 RepID=A0AAW0LUH4_QUESU
MEISLTSLGSSQTLPFPHLRTLEASRFWSLSDTITAAVTYCTSVRGLVLRLPEAISESLGPERDSIEKALGKQGQHMALNYYPPSPQPELTYGLPGHTDPNLISILLLDDVPGLQVLRNGKWIAVNPISNTFLVNIGDQMQVDLKFSF